MPTKSRGSKPTGQVASPNKFSPSKTPKTFPPGLTPKRIDRFRLLDILHVSAQSAVALEDASLDALADAAMVPRNAVKTYYKQCWDRMVEIYRQNPTPPLPPPKIDDIEPGF